jgi:hypothetical protein
MVVSQESFPRGKAAPPPASEEAPPRGKEKATGKEGAADGPGKRKPSKPGKRKREEPRERDFLFGLPSSASMKARKVKAGKGPASSAGGQAVESEETAKQKQVRLSWGRADPAILLCGFVGAAFIIPS